ncbi:MULTISPECIES: hypothetical protein [Aliagarivorans]|uniref:hypothetical protein n=1 Tax=Aliagarivorans TaxID=882379 RepID=UPI000412D645|nr:MULTISPECIES: hypothetical protein [Aliagarivorans]
MKLKITAAMLAGAALLSGCANTQAPAMGEAEFCQATLAMAFNRDAAAISVEQLEEYWRVDYQRPNGKLSQHRCKVEGEQVIWGNYPDGRWRDMEFDANYSYAIEGNELVITEQGRSGEKQQRFSF